STQFEEIGMKKMISVTLFALLVGGTFALPVQEAIAASGCTYVNGKKTCGGCTYVNGQKKCGAATAQPKTVCTTTGGVKHCRTVY
ncbi:MAG TPA: hypothetical protein VES89_03160, partial [Candidatus Competibacteraceae bacterium]|nr:hypothetical protein [Candidatus Competibacteraceae bacterium]